MPNEQQVEQPQGQQPAAQGGQTPQTGAQGQQQQQQQNQPAAQGQQQPPASTQANRGDDAQQRGLIADLQKERQARQRLEQDINTFKTQLAAEQRRVQALAGVNPKTAEESELDAVRERLVKMFPILGRLDEKQVDSLLGFQKQAASIEEVTQHHWTTHSRGMLLGLNEAVSKEIGQDLTERQKLAIGQAYIAEAERNPEFLARHESGDKTLLQEFAKAWAEDWFEPARKAVVTTEAQRFRKVPNGQGRTVQTTPPKPIDFKNAKSVEDAMVESFRRNGGSFDS